HLVRLAHVARDRVHQPVHAARGIVLARPARRHLVDGRRQVRQETPHAGERLFFGVDGVVDGARLELDLPAAELVLGELLAEPPPPEPSTSRISGRRSSWAIVSHCRCFSLIVASAEPPRTVKSSPPTTTGRPSTFARPKTKFDGVNVSRSLAAS